jgi:hypothetical protein
MKKYEAIVENRRFIIEQDEPDVGWYLYVFEDSVCIFDYLQDSLTMCQEQAQEDFSVPKDSWREL